jgi:hypothetical protein
MAQVSITQLPQAQALTGTESVPIVQSGVTVQTTTGAIAGAGALNYPFLTVGSTAGLSQARYLSAGSGLSVTDNGAGSTLQINLTGAAQSLNSSPTGIQVKTGANTLTGRSLAVGAGLGITNADGVSGDPTISLGTFLSNLASLTGTGILAIQSGSAAKIDILGTTSQISIANGNGAGNVTVGMASDPIVPGVGALTIPVGATGDRPIAPTVGQIRYNSTVGGYEAYQPSGWQLFSLAGGVTQVDTGTGLLGGPITSIGTISIDTTVVATTNNSLTLTNKTMSGLSNTFSDIGNSALTNSSIAINGSSVSLGGSVTVNATASNALTIGTGLTGTSYNGSSPVTIAIDSTVATLTGTQTLTNKTINGTNNTLSSIANASLVNSSITVGTTAISLGASSLTLGGLTTVTVTQDPTSNFELATKQYVDGVASTGLVYHLPVQVSTTQSLAAQTGGTVTYNNGVAGVGATLTLSVAMNTLDGYTLLNGDRILVQDEANQAHNGIYTWATGGTVLTRATDADTYGSGINNLSQNDYFFVQNGLVHKGNSFVVTTVGTIVFGTTAITFAEFSSSQVYTGTAPIQVSGTVISLNTVQTGTGGTGQTSYSVGDMLYYASGTALSKLAIGTNGYVVTSNGTAPQYVAQSTLSVGSATDATNTGITVDSTNATNYLTFVSATTGNLPQLVNSSITCNPSTGQITGGIAGGAF